MRVEPCGPDCAVAEAELDVIDGREHDECPIVEDAPSLFSGCGP